MIHERDIREKIAAVIRRDVSLSVFERWLVSNSSGMFGDSSDASIRLVAAVNLLIAELHDDIIDERAFRSELGGLLPRNLVIDVVAPVGFPMLPMFARHSMSNAQWLAPAVGAALVAVVAFGAVSANSSSPSSSVPVALPQLN